MLPNGNDNIIFRKRNAEGGVYIMMYEVPESEPHIESIRLHLKSFTPIRLYTYIDGRVAPLPPTKAAFNEDPSNSYFSALQIVPDRIPLSNVLRPGAKILAYIPRYTRFAYACKKMVPSTSLRQRIDEARRKYEYLKVPMFERDFWAEDTLNAFRQHNLVDDAIVTEHISKFLTGSRLPDPSEQAETTVQQPATDPSDRTVLTIGQTAQFLPKLSYERDEGGQSTTSASRSTKSTVLFMFGSTKGFGKLPLDTYLTVYETKKPSRYGKQVMAEYVVIEFKSQRRCSIEMHARQPQQSANDQVRLQQSTESSASRLSYHTVNYDRAYPEGTKIYLYAPVHCGKVSTALVERKIKNPTRELLKLLKKDPDVEMPVCSLPAALWKFEQ